VLDTLGWLYFQKGLVARAVSLLEDAHRRAPGLDAATLHLALAYRAAGREDAARPLLESLGARGVVAGAQAQLDAALAHPWLAAGGGLAACAPPAARRGPARLAEGGRPNLLLIVVDTLRADRTTPYGFSQDTTPELWPAARGVVFERSRSRRGRRFRWRRCSLALPRSHAIRDVRDGLGRPR
jgi:hypothetical protein